MPPAPSFSITRNGPTDWPINGPPHTEGRKKLRIARAQAKGKREKGKGTRPELLAQPRLPIRVEARAKHELHHRRVAVDAFLDAVGAKIRVVGAARGEANSRARTAIALLNRAQIFHRTGRNQSLKR